ncbi:CDP-alcohol phosphatidyltransferase family protein [Ferrimonas sediminicola]|uniref:CDP-alcohol phosphatidyltransferase family protein n=1 Tax=Ferrimonas sediminicola TaxID=2569538 RepID=A0A4U1B879_9GAMM|nr:CDP-alcohol phosphatidyltransferase family protein [Ferrimonas sediminicola]TKB46464.1 CDP-alcohol phosphatidyltransferase family protein [Ferrimonas sediminicola]
MNTFDLSFGGESYQKIVTKGNGLPYTKYINRPVAWFFTQRLYKVSPNLISLSAFLFLLIGLVAFYMPENKLDCLLLFFVLFINYALDSTDGQVSRLTGKGTKLGEWLDHSLDGLRIIIVNVYLILVVVNTIEFPSVSPVLFLCLISQVGLYIVGTLRQKVLNVDIAKEIRNSSRGKLATLILLPADYGVFMFLFLIASNPKLLYSVYSLYGLYNFGLLVVTMITIFVSQMKGR